MTAWAYYNEFDPHAAAWLRNLIKIGVIAPGEVDERDIRTVQPDDLRGFTQCHFFAGIGVWSYALRCAGISDDEPVWTGSCPCQGFSAAGLQRGFDDERHLWPDWFRLIDARRPHLVFGEQVASSLIIGKARNKKSEFGPYGLYEPDRKTQIPTAWLDLVCADMEGARYAVGLQAAPAAGVGAPQIRAGPHDSLSPLRCFDTFSSLSFPPSVYPCLSHRLSCRRLNNFVPFDEGVTKSVPRTLLESCDFSRGRGEFF